MMFGVQSPLQCFLSNVGFMPPPVWVRVARSVIAALLLAVVASESAMAGTLATVRDAGAVRCGVTQNGRGLTEQDVTGKWSGMFVDYCRALAAAVFGDASRIIIRPISTRLRFEALSAGDIDVLITNATVTLTRDVNLGIEFPAVYYYDGQGFMVHKASNPSRLED
jgi:general L-amino acid transport system substrate-binding protein